MSVSKVRDGVIVEKSYQGLKIEGYINDDLIITVSNFNLNRRFEVSQSKSLIGDLDKVKACNEIINAVLDKVESLKAEHEGHVSIAVVNRNGSWMVSIDGFDGDIDDSREDSISIARHFKQKYESLGVVVSYEEK